MYFFIFSVQDEQDAANNTAPSPTQPDPDAELSDNTDRTPSPTPVTRTKHNYHGNSDGNDSDREDSYPEDDEYDYPRTNGRSTRHEKRSGAESGLNIDEYLNRTDTAVIYPEPVDDPDIEGMFPNSKSAVLSKNTVSANIKHGRYFH